MRKLLLPALVLVALIIACENKVPNGPSGVGPGGVTVSLTTTTTTTSTSTTTTTVPATTPAPGPTTTSVVGSQSRRFITLNAPPNVPSDMSLFFQLLTSSLAPLPSLLGRLPFVGEAITTATATEIRYKVTGVYVTTNGTTGSIEGDLFGPVDPIQNGGEFHGVFRTTVSGCTAERVFRGPMGPGSLNLQGAEMIQDCPGSPLSFAAVNMTQSNSPPPPPAASSTTTSTTTTTTIAPCVLTVSPTSVQVPDTLITSPISITASAPECNWTAQALAPWLSVAPASGSGSVAVQVTSAANTNGPARVGTLLIAGQVVTINQAAPIPPDLVPAPLSVSSGGAMYCDFDQTLGTVVRAYTRNVGLGPATVQSFTTLFVNNTQQTLSQPVPAPLNPKDQVLSTFDLPDNCGSCQWRLTVDGTNIVHEGSTGADTNNFVDGTCFVSSPTGAARQVRTVIGKR